MTAYSVPRGRRLGLLLGAATVAVAAAAVIGACGPKRGLPPGGAVEPVGVMDPSGGTSSTGTYTPPSRRPTGDDPRVSRSRGSSGGVVLLWPRVIPSVRTQELRYAAAPLQAALAEILSSALPGVAVDRRPEPERVCPAAGCRGAAVGVVLIANVTGCAAVVQTTPPGREPAAQTPWAGDVVLKAPTVAFRQPPESFVRVTDYVPCRTIASHLKARRAQVEAAIRALRP